MDMVYFERPVFVLFPILLLLWQLLTYWLNKKTQISPLTDIVLTSIGVIGHAAAITVILLGGGTLSDALLLVLLSGSLSMFLSPKPNKTANKTQEGNN
ncbi:MAG: hypothetical protein J6D52_10080 [Clostridia bacterium]|nr:hypothetical protein [Clostridia bacterium]